MKKPGSQRNAPRTSGVQLLLTVCALFLARPVFAQMVPKLVNYQGRLTDAAGGPLPDGGYGIMIRVWGEPTGTNRLVWGQEFSNVVLVNGVFNLIMGGGVPIANAEANDVAAAFFEPNRFIGVTVIIGSNGAPIPNPAEMVPRQQVLSAPFAFTAERVATAAYATNSGTAAFATNAATANALTANGANVLSSDPSGNLLLGDTNRTNQEITVAGLIHARGGIRFEDGTIQTGASSGVGQAFALRNSEVFAGGTILSRQITLTRTNSRVLIMASVWIEPGDSPKSGVRPTIYLRRGSDELVRSGAVPADATHISEERENVVLFWVDTPPSGNNTYTYSVTSDSNGFWRGRVEAGAAQLVILEL